MSGSRRLGPLVAPALLTLLLSLGAASAATLEGRTTLRASPVSGALVRARNLDGPHIFITRTDAKGNYALKDLSAGSYLVEVEVEGQLAFRARIEVREPTNKHDIVLVTTDSVPYVSIQLVAAVDDAVVTINDVQVLRWGVDAGEIRRFELTRPSNTLEVSVINKASAASSIPFFGSRTPTAWRYHLIVWTPDGDKREFKAGQEAAAAWLQGKRFTVLRGTLAVEAAGRRVKLRNDFDEDLWQKSAPARRIPSIQF